MGSAGIGFGGREGFWWGGGGGVVRGGGFFLWWWFQMEGQRVGGLWWFGVGFGRGFLEIVRNLGVSFENAENTGYKLIAIGMRAV